MAELTDTERKVYKQKMKEIKEALDKGDKQKADRIANELKTFLGIR